MEFHIVGIDLGTTNSVIATVDHSGSVVVLPSASGPEITPSVVYFEPDGAVLAGAAAVRASVTDPDNGIRLVKRVMGTDFPLNVRGQDHTPESISALILRHLAGIGAAGSDRKVRAVITVPAYFGTREREATHQAGLIAGLDVLELLDEPVAAATHYGLTSGDRTLLVYDLGGGTFDTTVLRISSGVVRVLATDGHHELGGADVDGRLLDMIMERLEDQLSPAELDELAEDKALFGALALEAEAVKKDLSASHKRDILVATPAGQATVTVTREDLDAACSDLYSTTTEIIGRVLAAARLDRTSIDEVIMVGGSSRIPTLSARLAALLGKEPRLVEPDLAVAKGAALRAHHLVVPRSFPRSPRPAGRRADRRPDGRSARARSPRSRPAPSASSSRTATIRPGNAVTWSTWSPPTPSCRWPRWRAGLVRSWPTRTRFGFRCTSRPARCHPPRSSTTAGSSTASSPGSADFPPDR
jgi:molecular chaperone DnaK